MGIPSDVETYILDFHAAVRDRHVTRMLTFYDSMWPDMSERYFADKPWPSVAEVAPLVDDDAQFLSLYSLLAQTHVLDKVPCVLNREPHLEDFVAAWKAFQAFFALLGDASAAEGLELPAQWAWGIVSDYVSQFKYYTKLRQEGAGAGSSGVAIEEAVLASVWRLPDVIASLSKLAKGADLPALLAAGGPLPSGARTSLGYFALAGLTVLQCRVGNHAGAIDAARHLSPLAGDGPFARLPRCHATLQHHLAFSLMMARRFDDAHRVLSRTISHFARVHGAFGDYSVMPGTVRSTCERMLALLAVTAAVLPGAYMDDTARRVLKERLPDRLDVIAGAGVEGGEAAVAAARDAEVDAAFLEGAPSFIVAGPTPGGVAAALKDMLAVHASLFKAEVTCRVAGLYQLRSYMRLYTNMHVSKLASYLGSEAAEVQALLTTLKIKGWQAGVAPVPGVEGGAGAAPASAAGGAGGVGASASTDRLHFFLNNETVTVEETKSKGNAVATFVRGIENLARYTAEPGTGGRGGGRRRQRGGGGDRDRERGGDRS